MLNIAVGRGYCLCIFRPMPQSADRTKHQLLMTRLSIIYFDLPRWHRQSDATGAVPVCQIDASDIIEKTQISNISGGNASETCE
jgi:hypothetical protein